MQFYEAYGILNSAESMTGNKKFSEIKELLTELEDLYKKSAVICQQFPTKDEDIFYNRNALSLQDKVKQRISQTNDFINQVKLITERLTNARNQTS